MFLNVYKINDYKFGQVCIKHFISRFTFFVNFPLDICRVMEELRLLEKLQPCGDLDIDSKLGLVSDFVPKISGPFLEEISRSIQRDDGEAKPANTSSAKSQKSHVNKVDPDASQKHEELSAMVGLDAMKRANSTLEDFSRSYFVFHQLEISQPQSMFRYLPILSFTESYIYQVDVANEKMVTESAGGSQVICSNHGSRVLFETDPLKPLADVLEREGVLTQRIRQEFNSGKEYWALERQLCGALSNKNKICLEDVMRAIQLKSFDYRVLNLLLYKLRGEEVNELHMDFLSVSVFLVEIADDLLDYEDDVLQNSFNVLRMFVGIFGPLNAPTELAKQISEAEEKFEELMKSLDPHLSSSYNKRCEGATQEVYGHAPGEWKIPAVISDEEAYRAARGLQKKSGSY